VGWPVVTEGKAKKDGGNWRKANDGLRVQTEESKQEVVREKLFVREGKQKGGN